MGESAFNPIDLFTPVTEKDRRRWKREAKEKELLSQRRSLAQKRKRTRAKREKVLREQQLESAFIEYVRVESLNPNRKSLCKVPKSPSNGFKRKHTPNPKNKIRVDRSKIRKPDYD